jgi:hypothetical protein
LADGDPDHAAPRLIGTTLSASVPVTNALQADMIGLRLSSIELLWYACTTALPT